MHQPVGMRNQSGTERRNEAERKRVGKAKVQKRKKRKKKMYLQRLWAGLCKSVSQSPENDESEGKRGLRPLR